MKAKALELNLVCPECGAIIEISGSVKSVRREKREDQELLKNVLGLFTRTQQANLEVSVLEDGSFAKVEWKGKFNRPLWSKVNGEIRGYGGRFVKGHWLLPLAVFQEAE